MTATLVSIVHIAVCLFLIGIVLLQQGKGADAGATFGGGGGQTFFGASGADTFLTKITTGLAVLFMATSVLLAMHGNKVRSGEGTIFQDAGTVSVDPQEAIPGAPLNPEAAEETTETSTAASEATPPPTPGAADQPEPNEAPVTQ